MREVKINVGWVIWGFPLLAALAYRCGPHSLAAWALIILMVPFVLLNVFSAAATLSRRKYIATRPPPPRGGTLNAVFGVLLWSLLFSWLWTIGWFGDAIIAGVSLVSLIVSVSIGRGRPRSI